eukprot:XP_001693923.1 predicted protein [Chlamydomonas reinhardtii]
MMYGKGLAEEERLHDSFHNAHGAVFRFPGWAAERVLLRGGGDSRSRLLCVLPTDPPAHWRKVVEMCGRLDKVLGVPEGHLLAPQPPCKVFVWVSQEAPPSGSGGAGSRSGGGCGGGKGRCGRVVGVLVAQLQSRAQRRLLVAGPAAQPQGQRSRSHPKQQHPQQQHPQQQPHVSDGRSGSATRPQASQSQSRSQHPTHPTPAVQQLPQPQAKGPDAATAAPSAAQQLELEQEQQEADSEARACVVPGFLAARTQVAFSAGAAAAAAGEPDGGAAFVALAASYGRAAGGAGTDTGTATADAVKVLSTGHAGEAWALLYDDA